MTQKEIFIEKSLTWIWSQLQGLVLEQAVAAITPLQTKMTFFSVLFYDDAWKFCLQSEEFPLSNKIEKLPEFALELHELPPAPARPPRGVGQVIGLAGNPGGA